MRIAYICEVGPGRGRGHLERGRSLLELADERSALVVGEGFGTARDLVGNGGLRVVAWDHDQAPCDPATAKWDIVVVDDYYVSAAWIATCNTVVPTFVVDDWMRVEIAATGLINVNLGADRGDYPKVNVRRWLLGSEYALVKRGVRSLGRRPVARGKVEEILVTLGGSDPDGHTAQIVTDLAASRWYMDGGRIIAVMGTGYSGDRPWERWASPLQLRITAVTQPVDFPMLLQRTDLAICGASTISYELAFLGTPFVPIAFVDNQAVIVREWARVGVGVAVRTWETGWREKLLHHIAELIQDPSRRAASASSAAATVDGCGAERLLTALREEFETRSME